MNYDAKSAKYYDKVLAPALNRIRKYTVKIIKKHNFKSVVDFCCGTGNQLKFLKKAGFEDVIGVDLSENMIAQTKVGKINPKCLLEDATNTTLPENYYDVAMVSLAMHEKSKDVAVGMINEAKRVVKPNGFFIATDYCFDEKSFFPGRWGATWVEKKVGGEHYENFKKYIAFGGLNNLMKDYIFIEEKRFLFGAVSLRLYKF